MSLFKEGDILFVLFPFEERDEGKMRPALFWRYRGAKDEWLIISKITSHGHGFEWEIKVQPSPINGLTNVSYIQIDKTRKIHFSKVHNKMVPLGRLEDDLLSLARQKLREYIASVK